jgi:spore germination cell wall hydrolase CwlJ-like protein
VSGGIMCVPAVIAGMVALALHGQQPADRGITVDISDVMARPPSSRTTRNFRAVAARPELWSPSARHERAERNLAAMLLGECRGQSIVCMQAVGHVAMNRAREGRPARYGDGLYGVIRRHAAFSCMLRSDNSWRVVSAALAGKLPPHSPDGIKWTMALGEAHILMHRSSPDPTKGATFYYAASIRPAWVHDRGMVRTAALDGHVFYRKEA